MKRLGGFILALVGTSVVSADVHFYAPFDSSVKMQAGRLDVRSEYAGDFEFTQGRRGKALMVGAKRPGQLIYECNEAFLSPKGALEIWLQPLAWKGIDQDSPFSLSLTMDNQSFFSIFKEKGKSNLIFLFQDNLTRKTYFTPIYDWTKEGWQNLLVNRDGDKLDLYVNGQRAAEYKENIELPRIVDSGGKSRLTIEAQKATAADELRIYDQAIPENEIEERYVSALLREKSYANPILCIPFTEHPPVKEGKVDVKVWDQAATVTDFIQIDSAEKFSQQTWVSIMYDDQHVYLLYESPVIARHLAGGPRPRDIANGGDEIEFYVMPKYTEVFDFFQFIGNPWGSIFDSRGRNDWAWSGNWFYRCNVDEKRWYAEVWVNDFAPLSASKPVEGATWSVNFCRNWRTGTAGWTQWSHTPGAYSNYKGFGKLIFAGKDTVVTRVKSIADVDRKNETISAVFDLVNPSRGNKIVNVKYDFYPQGDYLPLSTLDRKVILTPAQKQAITLTLAMKSSQAGTVEIKVSDGNDGRIYFQQMVKVKAEKQISQTEISQ